MRQLYSVRKDCLGMTLRPAKRASLSSKTELMTWLWRALPKSFSAKERAGNNFLISSWRFGAGLQTPPSAGP